MVDDYRVKGSSIRSKFDYVGDTFGAAAERELRESFASRPGLMPVLDSSMYPFAIYDEINRAIAERHLDGDLARLEEVGSYSAEKVLTTVYRAFAAGKDFIGFLKRAAVLHERFYSHGKMWVTIGAGGSSARIDLDGAPVYSEADLHIAAGFYRGAAKLLGIPEMRCTFVMRDDGARFELDWGEPPAGAP